MAFFGYIGIIFSLALWIITLLGVVIMVIFGLIHYTKRQSSEDPGEADPDVFSGSGPGLNQGEMSPFEASSVKPSLPMLIAAMLGVLAVFGFSAYGLKEMAAGTKTTAVMRKEAKDMAASKRKKYGGGGIEDEGAGRKKRKRTKAFDIKTR